MKNLRFLATAIGMVVCISLANALTAADLNTNKEKLIQYMETKSAAELADAIAAGVGALSNVTERNAFADAFATSIGFEPDPAVPDRLSIYRENMKKMVFEFIDDADEQAAWDAVKAALAPYALEPESVVNP